MQSFYNTEIDESNLKEDIQKSIKMISNARKITVSTHTNPDGDAIGSALAMLDYLKQKGKDCKVINDSETPDNLTFLDPGYEINVFDQYEDYDFIAQSDLIIILDLNDPARLKSMKDAVTDSNAKKLLIDHHLEPVDFTDHMVIDTDSTSTGELVYQLLKADDEYKFTNISAYALYAAIMTDTGSFRHPRTDAQTHLIIADLIRHGADPVRIYDEIYNINSLSNLRLLGEAYKNIKLYFNGFLCIMTITDALLKKHNADNNDLEGFVEKTMSLRGVKIGIMMSEVKERNEIRLSMRSKGEYSVREIASELGGGGHFHASGARIKDASIEEARSGVLGYIASRYNLI